MTTENKPSEERVEAAAKEMLALTHMQWEFMTEVHREDYRGLVRRVLAALASKVQPLPVRDEREAFEAVARKEGFIDSRMIRVGDGYANRELLRAWRFWQARAALASEEPPRGKANSLTQPAPEAQQAEEVATVIAVNDFEGRIQWRRAGKRLDLGVKLYTRPQQPAQGVRFTHEVVPLSTPKKRELAGNYFSEQWAIQHAIDLMHDHERACAEAWDVMLAGEFALPRRGSLRTGGGESGHD